MWAAAMTRSISSSNTLLKRSGATSIRSLSSVRLLHGKILEHIGSFLANAMDLP